jgi:hypothetical protein
VTLQLRGGRNNLRAAGIFSASQLRVRYIMAQGVTANIKMKISTGAAAAIVITHAGKIKSTR